MSLNIPLSVLELAMVPQNQSPDNAFSNAVALAQHTESLGFNRFWLAEHHNMEGVASTATVVLIGHIAAKTTTIRVGSGGIMLPNHAPLVVAEQFGTLGTLFPGRIDLGLGRAPGTDQMTATALRRDMKAVMDFEGNIKELRQYFSPSNNTAAVRAIPGEGVDVPIWVLGSSTDSAYVAAALGLPYAFASHFAPAQLFEAISIYKEHFKPSAQLSAPYVMPCINVIAADTDEEARVMATSFKRLFLGILTGKRQKMGPPEDPDTFMDPMEEAALQQMIRFTFTGSKDTLQRNLQRFIEVTGCNELMITSPIYNFKDRLRSYEIVSGL